MMSDVHRKQIKEKILQEIEKTKILIVELKELTKPISPENAIGRVSRMDAINNKSINDLGLRKQENKLRKLEIALSKIELENFGVCSMCKNSIQEGRIMLMPESSFCVRCSSRR